MRILEKIKSLVKPEVNKNNSVGEDVLVVKELNLTLDRTRHDFMIKGLNYCIILSNKLGFEFTVRAEDYAIIAIAPTFNLRVQVSSWEELYILNEIYIQGCYNFSNSLKTVVVDIGMNSAFASLYFAQKEEVFCVLSYEPFEDTYRAALRNIDLNPHLKPKIQTFNYGLGDSDKVIALDYASNWRGSVGLRGLDDFKRRQATSITKIDVEIKDIHHAILKALEFNLPVVCKMDCEGAEYELFDRLEQLDLLRHIQGFMIEWHDKGPDSLISVLKKLNFVCISQSPFSKDIGMVYAFRQ